MQFLLSVSNWQLKEPSATYIEKVQFIRCATDAVGEKQQVPWKVSASAWSSLGRTDTAYSKRLLGKEADDQHRDFGLCHS